MTDVATLARRARTALIEAREATLLIQGVSGPAQRTGAVLLHEDAGRPRLMCHADSPVRIAAHGARAAILTVACDGAATAVFAGELAVGAIETVDGIPHYVIGLELSSLFVEQPTGDSVRRHAVPLEVYFDGGHDALAQYAGRLRTHTNTAHAAQLRALVAGRTGQHERGIAAARLSEIDQRGAVLEWVDEQGAHERQLCFPRDARTPGELSLAVRAVLGR
jgi:aromatic ring-cleaving dioxygenase